jgi:hypothetical protein
MNAMKKVSVPLVLLGSLCGALLGSSPGHAAPPPPAGTDFQVNVATQGSQGYPAAAQDAGGNSVVVWVDQGAAPVTVKARRFDAAGAPVTAEIVVGPADPYTPPHVAMTLLGEFAVVWLQGQHVFLRRYDRLGRPQGDAIPVQRSAGEIAIPAADVALDATGGAFVVWAISRQGGDDVLLQRFDAASQPLGAPETVNQAADGLRSSPRVAVNAADSLLISWDDLRSTLSDSWARRFDGPTGAWGPEAQVSASASGVHAGGVPILYPEGDGAVVYLDFTHSALRVRRFDAHGVPFPGEITAAAAGTVGASPPAAAAGADGTAVAAWQGATDPLLHAAFFDRDWQPLGAAFPVSSPAGDVESLPAVAAGETGSLLVAWTSGGIDFPIPELPPDFTPGRDGSGWGVYAQRFQAPACAAGTAHLCLGDGQRFDVQVSWKNPYTGETGTGRSLPLTGDTGAFWFFDPANLEVMVKVLDGRAVNGNFWVFYGSLSNVEYTVTVTDTTTGAKKSYHNAPLQFASRADVDAFPGGATATVAAPQAAGALVPPPALRPVSFAAADCAPTLTALCLQNRFRVEVSLIDPRTDTFGPGEAVPLSGDTGAFWFFAPSNLELMVKVLDGGAINGHFWVFYGGLSDVNYVLTVTDTATGAQRTYDNPLHHLASAADLDAFTAGPTAGK